MKKKYENRFFHIALILGGISLKSHCQQNPWDLESEGVGRSS
jgi:hypothetical protein